jgi:4-amino-4-deoxy-L-arabinose transferase-like glycosyltransferase
MKKITYIHLLYICVGLMLLLGLIISPDYGYTTDEGSERTRAKIALSHYGIPNDNPKTSYEQIYHKKYYGTAVSMVGVLANDLLSPILDAPINAIWHGFNYFIFILSVVGCFYLVRLFASGSIALFASLLYASQPLYFGHAFMNPKDMPLVAMFILTITLGFYIERHPTWRSRISLPYTFGTQLRHWRSVIACWGVFLRWMNAIMLFFLISLLFLKQWIIGLIGWSAHYSYANPSSLPGRIFWIFVDIPVANPPENYVHKLNVYFERAYPLLIIAISLYLGCVFFLAFRRHPTLRKNSPILWHSANIVLLAAGVVLGIALSTRIIAIAAGGIVGLYYLWSYGQKAIPPLTLYSVTAFFVHYITWPLYWENNFFTIIKDSLSLLQQFTPQSGVPVPFEGKLFNANSLPNYYLAKLLTLQFTLPLLLLAIFGIIVWLVFNTHKRCITPNFRKEVLILLWFLLPFAFITIKSPIMYNSFRQFLFITPPFIVFVGIGIEKIKPYIPRWIILGIFALSLVPGVMADINLHPYQYIYYNRFAGGVRGAFETYALDYWYLSTSEAMAYINETVEPDTTICVIGGHKHAKIYQRPDLNIPKVERFTDLFDFSCQYAVVSTNYFYHRQVPLQWRVLHTVEVQNTPLFFIYSIE